jgi:hypothetical protein
MSRNFFMERMERTKNLTKSHKRAPKQETEVAKLIGARKVAASGAKHEKGDVRIKGVTRIECKTTKNKSFSVTLEMAEKLEHEAALAGEVPIFVIEFNDPITGKKIKDLVVMPGYALETLLKD